jgi:glutamine amidotransferase
MIVIIDYGLGNVGSIHNMLKKISVDSVISRDRSVIEKAEKMILPGVGAYDIAMQNLNELNLFDLLNYKVREQKTPILGICLGMQILGKTSEEGVLPGFGWIDADVKKFKLAQPFKVPHMGWNIVYDVKQSHLFQNMHQEELRYYFVHSYYFEAHDKSTIIGETDYGGRFTSAVNQNNVWGVQFHPEKSHKFGMNLLKNFSEV